MEEMTVGGIQAQQTHIAGGTKLGAPSTQKPFSEIYKEAVLKTVGRSANPALHISVPGQTAPIGEVGASVRMGNSKMEEGAAPTAATPAPAANAAPTAATPALAANTAPTAVTPAPAVNTAAPAATPAPAAASASAPLAPPSPTYYAGSMFYGPADRPEYVFNFGQWMKLTYLTDEDYIAAGFDIEILKANALDVNPLAYINRFGEVHKYLVPFDWTHQFDYTTTLGTAENIAQTLGNNASFGFRPISE